jgi:hypothetical protein
MTLKPSQKSLRSWEKQDWGTKSGKKSSETGERYLPKAARDALTSAEYAATSRKKREDTKKGKQHSKQPKKIARKTRQFRKVRNIGGGVNVTKAPPEFLMEIGEYSKAEPTNSLVEQLQKRKKRQDIAFGVAMAISPIGKFKKVKDAFGTVHKGKIKGFNVEIYRDPGLTAGQQYAMVIKDPKVIMDKSKSIGLYSKNLDEAKESAVDEITELMRKGSLTDITMWAAKNPDDKIIANINSEFLIKAIKKYPEKKYPRKTSEPLEEVLTKAIEDNIF